MLRNKLKTLLLLLTMGTATVQANTLPHILSLTTMLSLAGQATSESRLTAFETSWTPVDIRSDVNGQIFLLDDDCTYYLGTSQSSSFTTSSSFSGNSQELDCRFVKNIYPDPINSALDLAIYASSRQSITYLVDNGLHSGGYGSFISYPNQNTENYLGPWYTSGEEMKIASAIDLDGTNFFLYGGLLNVDSNGDPQSLFQVADFVSLYGAAVYNTYSNVNGTVYSIYPNTLNPFTPGECVFIDEIAQTAICISTSYDNLAYGNDVGLIFEYTFGPTQSPTPSITERYDTVNYPSKKIRHLSSDIDTGFFFSLTTGSSGQDWIVFFNQLGGLLGNLEQPIGTYSHDFDFSETLSVTFGNHNGYPSWTVLDRDQCDVTVDTTCTLILHQYTPSGYGNITSLSRGVDNSINMIGSLASGKGLRLHLNSTTIYNCTDTTDITTTSIEATVIASDFTDSPESTSITLSANSLSLTVVDITWSQGSPTTATATTTNICPTAPELNTPSPVAETTTTTTRPPTQTGYTYSPIPSPTNDPGGSNKSNTPTWKKHPWIIYTGSTASLLLICLGCVCYKKSQDDKKVKPHQRKTQYPKRQPRNPQRRSIQRVRPYPRNPQRVQYLRNNYPTTSYPQDPWDSWAPNGRQFNPNTKVDYYRNTNTTSYPNTRISIGSQRTQPPNNYHMDMDMPMRREPFPPYTPVQGTSPQTPDIKRPQPTLEKPYPTEEKLNLKDNDSLQPTSQNQKFITIEQSQPKSTPSPDKDRPQLEVVASYQL